MFTVYLALVCSSLKVLFSRVFDSYATASITQMQTLPSGRLSQIPLHYGLCPREEVTRGRQAGPLFTANYQELHVQKKHSA